MKCGAMECEINKNVLDHRALSEWSGVIDKKNQTNTSCVSVELPIDMVFNDGHRLSIVVYTILLIISGIANTSFLKYLIKRRLKQPSKIDIMLMHLALADLIVTFVLMPLEISWAFTVQWIAGDIMCRLMMFFRIFGLYLSSFVLVCISLDRYFAVLKPFNLSIRRSRMMLLIAWIFGFLCSIPQAIIFHLETHPNHNLYTQCVTFHFFTNDTHEMAYQIISFCLLFPFPLFVVTFCYVSIYIEIYKNTKTAPKGIDKFRRSNDDILSRAKRRTLKMTVTIVIVFVVCWTPYYIMCIWYWIDRHNALEVDQRIQRVLFLFACTNSCMNPIVYGIFHHNSKCVKAKVPSKKISFKQQMDQVRNQTESQIIEEIV
ncbi:GNRHR family protein [Megaselia abdita]